MNNAVYVDSNMTAEDQRFNQQLKQYAAKTMPAAHLFDLGIARDFKIANWNRVRMTMQQFVVTKALTKHGLTLSELLDLPGLVHAPIMIFASRTEPGAFVTLLGRKALGGDLIVATHCLVHKNLGPQHSVRSVYPKRRTSILEWINDGLVLYEDKEKSHVWLQDSAPSN